MIDEDEKHEKVREWVEEQGWKPESLDELIYRNKMGEDKPFMTDKQAKEADELMKMFD